MGKEMTQNILESIAQEKSTQAFFRVYRATEHFSFRT